MSGTLADLTVVERTGLLAQVLAGMEAGEQARVRRVIAQVVDNDKQRRVEQGRGGRTGIGEGLALEIVAAIGIMLAGLPCNDSGSGAGEAVRAL